MSDKNKRESEGLWEIPLTILANITNIMFKEATFEIEDGRKRNLDIGDIDVDKINEDNGK
jgi:hypothetical protein